MIKISILYPSSADAKFDFDYYTQKRMPRSIELLSSHPGFRGVTVERGRPEAPTPDRELQADMVHYTDIAPQIQFNEILIDRSVAA